MRLSAIPSRLFLPFIVSLFSFCSHHLIVSSWCHIALLDVIVSSACGVISCRHRLLRHLVCIRFVCRLVMSCRLSCRFVVSSYRRAIACVFCLKSLISPLMPLYGDTIIRPGTRHERRGDKRIAISYHAACLISFGAINSCVSTCCFVKLCWKYVYMICACYIYGTRVY